MCWGIQDGFIINTFSNFCEEPVPLIKIFWLKAVLNIFNTSEQLILFLTQNLILHRWKSSRLYQKVLQGLEKRWHKCIISEGDYFEGDNIDIDE